MRHVAGRGQHHSVRGVVPAHVPAHRALVQLGDRLGRAEHRSAQRVARPERLGEDIVDRLVRRVLVPLDLLDHHVLLEGQIVRVQARVEHHVREHVHRHARVLRQRLGVEAGALLVRKGVQRAAPGLDLLGDLLSRALLRALEEHMLDEVGDPAHRRRLIHRSRVHPEPDRHRLDMAHRFRHNAHPIGQRRHFYGLRVHSRSFVVTGNPTQSGLGTEAEAAESMERETGLEPATLCLGSRCSTTELFPHVIVL